MASYNAKRCDLETHIDATSHMVVFFELNESQWLAKYLVVTCGFLDFGVSWH